MLVSSLGVSSLDLGNTWPRAAWLSAEVSLPSLSLLSVSSSCGLDAEDFHPATGSLGLSLHSLSFLFAFPAVLLGCQPPVSHASLASTAPSLCLQAFCKTGNASPLSLQGWQSQDCSQAFVSFSALM